LTLASYEATLAQERSEEISTEDTSNNTDDLSIRRFGKYLRSVSNPTNIAAEDRESHAAYAGDLSLSDIDDRF
jgi:hypothetical protein